MTQEKIPVLLLKWNDVQKVGRRLRGLGQTILKLFPKLDDTLPKIGIDVDAEAYAAGSFVSSLLYGVLFFLVTAIALSSVAQARTFCRWPLGSVLASGCCFSCSIWSIHPSS
jgi:hypothetical protein